MENYNQISQNQPHEAINLNSSNGLIYQPKDSALLGLSASTSYNSIQGQLISATILPPITNSAFLTNYGGVTTYNTASSPITLGVAPLTNYTTANVASLINAGGVSMDGIFSFPKISAQPTTGYLNTVVTNSFINTGSVSMDGISSFPKISAQLTAGYLNTVITNSFINTGSVSMDGISSFPKISAQLTTGYLNTVVTNSFINTGSVSMDGIFSFPKISAQPTTGHLNTAITNSFINTGRVSMGGILSQSLNSANANNMSSLHTSRAVSASTASSHLALSQGIAPISNPNKLPAEIAEFFKCDTFDELKAKLPNKVKLYTHTETVNAGNITIGNVIGDNNVFAAYANIFYFFVFPNN